jgi:hypothetical protein
VAGKISSIEKFNYLIGNQTHDLPVCRIVPQPVHHRLPWPSEGTERNSATFYIENVN